MKRHNTKVKNPLKKKEMQFNQIKQKTYIEGKEGCSNNSGVEILRLTVEKCTATGYKVEKRKEDSGT